jgi:hypothetical protein
MPRPVNAPHSPASNLFLYVVVPEAASALQTTVDASPFAMTITITGRSDAGRQNTTGSLVQPIASVRPSGSDSFRVGTCLHLLKSPSDGRGLVRESMAILPFVRLSARRPEEFNLE